MYGGWYMAIALSHVEMIVNRAFYPLRVDAVTYFKIVALWMGLLVVVVEVFTVAYGECAAKLKPDARPEQSASATQSEWYGT